MFVAFVSDPCPRIYIPTNVCTSFRLILIKIVPITLQPKLCPNERGKFWLPTKIPPPLPPE